MLAWDGDACYGLSWRPYETLKVYPVPQHVSALLTVGLRADGGAAPCAQAR